MSIQKKLYYGFGAVLLILALLFGVSWISMDRQQKSQASLRVALEEKGATEAVNRQMMQNRLALGNYLLSGDTREADKMTAGVAALEKKIELAEGRAGTAEQRNALARVR